MNIALILAYLIVSSVCISLFYLFYRLFLHKDTEFRVVRIYLISAAIFSFILPFTNLSVNLDLPSVGTAEYFVNQIGDNTELKAENIDVNPIITAPSQALKSESILQNSESISPSSGNTISWAGIILLICLLGSIFLMVRLIQQIVVICLCFYRSDKIKDNSIFIIRNSTFDHPFSFFNWIFIPDKIKPGKEMNDIIQHEKIHSRQWHSADMLIAEVLIAIMWFNPLIWMMKNSVQLIHEYLADRGALDKGLDKVFYQTLLVNQVAEGRLIPLSSCFNHSIIKKRITMMSKTKSNRITKLKLIGIIPVIILLLLGIACAKTQEKQVPSEVNGKQTIDDVITAIVPVKMNVLYVGVDNPVSVAVSGYKSEDLEVRIDNGRIRGQNGEFIVNPGRTGESNITVSVDGKDVGSFAFRVKSMPDPLPRIGVKRNGAITKNELLEAGGINAWMRTDFDVMFKVISFKMGTTDPSGFYIQDSSDTDRFSERQTEIINSLVKDQKLYFEEIKAIGPDGAIRVLDVLSFTISE